MSSFKFSGRSFLAIKSEGLFLLGFSTSESDDSSESSFELLIANFDLAGGAFLVLDVAFLFSSESSSELLLAVFFLAGGAFLVLDLALVLLFDELMTFRLLSVLPACF